jgi:hypothetical protein
VAKNTTGGRLTGYNSAGVESQINKDKARDVQRASGHVEQMCDEMFGKDSSKLPWPKNPNAGGTRSLKYSKRSKPGI